MTETYEKPYLKRLQTGAMNKFGARYLKPVRSDIDGVPVGRLAEKFGSPLYVFSERRLRRAFRRFRTAFTTRYPNMGFTWSYKTNYLDALCAVLHEEGEWAEVVSDFEYEKARHVGVPGERIVFNGPYKPRHVLERAVREGARIHVDHLEEIHDLEAAAGALGRKIPVGLRVNMDTGITPQWTRFGFNLESGQAREAARRIASGGRLELAGLHCHLGTYILEPRAYRRAAEKLVRFAYEAEESLGCRVQYLDLGGGFPSQARLKGTYLPPELAVPSLDAFAEALAEGLHRTLRPGDFPEVLLEAGRAVVDEAGFLIATVHAVKRLPDGKKAYIIDAGLNLLFTSFWYKHHIEIDREVAGPLEDCIVYGPLCMNIDVVVDHVRLPILPRGCRMVISPVGAYNITQSMQFIFYRPRVVLVAEDGSVDVIREAETLEDVIARERLPERLRKEPPPP